MAPDGGQDFRNKLIEVEKDKLLAEHECSSLQTAVDQERKKVIALEARVVGYESDVIKFQQQVEEKEAILVTLKQELKNQGMLLNQELLEKERLRREYSNKIAAEKEKNSLVTLKRLKDQEVEFKTQMKNQEEKLRKVKQILRVDSSLSSHAAVHPTRSVATPCQFPVVSETSNVNSCMFSPQRSEQGPAVSNPRHTRSQSAGGGIWLDHRPVASVKLDTVMQPLMKRHKSITKLTEVKDFTNPKTSKYCLMTQEQDSSGELETCLYKADMVPTAGGGAQVIFNDVEILKQQSPTVTPAQKRSASTGELKDTEAACAVAVEGHKRARH